MLGRDVAAKRHHLRRGGGCCLTLRRGESSGDRCKVQWLSGRCAGAGSGRFSARSRTCTAIVRAQSAAVPGNVGAGGVLRRGLGPMPVPGLRRAGSVFRRGVFPAPVPALLASPPARLRGLVSTGRVAPPVVVSPLARKLCWNLRKVPPDRLAARGGGVRVLRPIRLGRRLRQAPCSGRAAAAGEQVVRPESRRARWPAWHGSHRLRPAHGTPGGGAAEGACERLRRGDPIERVW
mmetsp:Transcript_66123/g.209017  ORF Transcript_66123/g.209017 Transcript_66123/m.209017 type:complete len:235 (-) Transcript_66123:276-980(-)